MNKKQIIQFMIVLIILPFLWQSGCVPSKSAYVKDGKEYGKVRGSFRHRWWNYYERGISFSNGRFFTEAVKDFQEAVEQRDKDQRMARTYGMHFIDYFPHRELGVLYYETGALVRAKKELETSLGSFPSAKAHFYLDRVRKALIEQSMIDVPPPLLTLDFKNREIWTRDDPVIVSGAAEDENYVADISINSMPLFMESARKDITFKKSLNLVQGRHVVTVSVKNLLGKITKKEVIMHVDREGPVLTIDKLEFDKIASGTRIMVSGWIQDAAGVSQLSVNGKGQKITTGIEVPFKIKTIIDDNTLELTTLDGLKNKTTASIPLDLITSSRSAVLVASADFNAQDLVAANLYGNSKDLTPPVIRLKGWADEQTVFLNKIYIEGSASDKNSVEKLTVNSVPIKIRKGRYLFFGHMVQLNKGKNSLTIEAVDQAGNIAQKTITITRKISAARKLSQRLSMSACPFDQKGEVSSNSTAFQNNLINAFVNQKRFRVVERNKLESILMEQKLSQTDLFDQSTAIKLGRLIGAHSIVTGSIIETRNGIEVVSRLIDTDTSDILSSQDVYSETKNLAGLDLLAQGVAIKFYRDFPLTQGIVLAVKNQSISTDLGMNSVKLQRRLIVFRDEPAKQTLSGNSADAENQKYGSENQILGYARVNQVMPELSKARLSDGKMLNIKPMDKVIVQ